MVIIVIIMLTLVVGAAGAGWYAHHKTGKDKKNQQAQAQKAAAAKATANSNKPIQYQVVYVDKSQTPVRILIYTSETDSNRLISVNDAVFAKYKTSGSTLLFAYFDDPKIALDYFTKINQSGLSAAEKQDLQKHYVAAMVYVNIPSQKTKVATFTRLVNGVKTLKTY